MRQISPEAKTAASIMAALGSAMLCSSIVRYGLPVQDLPTFASLTALSVVASLYPVHTPSGKSYHSLGNMFRYAGLFLLPLSWALLMCFARLPSDAYRRAKDKRLSIWIVPLWNASVVAVLSHVAAHFLDLYGSRPPISVQDWLRIALVGVAFEGCQLAFVYLWVSINEHARWRSIGPLVTPEGFVVDVLQAYSGALLATQWHIAPIMLPLALLACFANHRVVILAQSALEFTLDPKTQLYNARHLEKRLSLAIDRSLKKGEPVSLVFADLDYLREINNTYGHLAGDTVLQAVGAVLRRATGNGAVASRFGGEEFILLLPNMAKEDAVKLAEQLRATLASGIHVLPSGEKIRVTMSFGVATCPDDARTNYDLIRAADLAMYQAKASGRNRVAWAGSLPPDWDRSSNKLA